MRYLTTAILLAAVAAFSGCSDVTGEAEAKEPEVNQSTDAANSAGGPGQDVLKMALCAGYYTAALGADYVPDKSSVAQLATAFNTMANEMGKVTNLDHEVAKGMFDTQMHFARLEASNPRGFMRSTRDIDTVCRQILQEAAAMIAANR